MTSNNQFIVHVNGVSIPDGEEVLVLKVFPDRWRNHVDREEVIIKNGRLSINGVSIPDEEEVLVLKVFPDRWKNQVEREEVIIKNGRLIYLRSHVLYTYAQKKLWFSQMELPLTVQCGMLKNVQ